jgi:ABC-type transporter Mla maintaining outer membrane lipid asymmetry permease subunit MlaE
MIFLKYKNKTVITKWKKIMIYNTMVPKVCTKLPQWTISSFKFLREITAMFTDTTQITTIMSFSAN